MTPERWQQVKEIFNSAIKYLPEHRDMFIAQACRGDEALRSEVESLITSHEKDGSFIDEPAYYAAAELLANEKSELPSGYSIGNYEVVSFISRGGMGEVYLAQDRRLSRRVALKLLPDAFTKDNDRLRRFEQEARAASALNHPNIITIYEIFQTNSTHVIATEFVEGETLRQRLNRSGLSLSEALNISIQIADALAAAHKAGIIHRDIKPENVMLRPDGYVKILDFGLAKLSEETTAVVAAEAPTIQVRTGSGLVLGTAGYMSPEQARGLPVDNRSDVFSFGAVMYEMLARRKPFEGETPSDTMAAILKSEPAPLPHIVPQLPAELVRIVNKSLRKDREERYQAVKELWLDLKALKQELEFQAKLDRSVPSDTGDGLTGSMPRAHYTAAEARAELTGARSGISTITESLTIEIKRHKFGVAVALAIVLAAIGLGAFGIYKLINRKPEVAAYQNIHLSRLTNSGDVIDATISPDGKYLVYVRSDRNRQSLWIRQVSTANDKEIVPQSPVGFFGITFSPDGNDIYYAIKAQLDAGTLYRIPTLGGPTVKVLEKIDGPISFAPDGKRFVMVRGNYPNPGESALVIANVDGSNEQILATRQRPDRFTPIFFTGPSWSPDGKLIAATVISSPRMCNVVVFSIADGKQQVLTREPWTFASRVEWLPDMSGLLVIAGEGVNTSQHWILSYPAGEKRRVTNDLSAYRVISLTGDGRKLATIQVDGLINLWVAPEGDATRAVGLPTGNVGFYSSAGNNLCWTMDNRVVYMSNEGGVPDVWIADPLGGNRKQLTTNGAGSPVATSDGKYIVFVSARDGKLAVWRMNIDGSNPVRLSSGPGDAYPSLTPDGKWVVYIKYEGAKPTIWKVSLDGGTPVQVTDHVASSAIVSPDGKLLAYSYPESPDPYAPPNRIAIVNFADNTPVATFSFGASSTVPTLIQWSPDGKSILYSVNRESVSNVWSQPLKGGEPKQTTFFRDGLMTGFAWSSDGKMFAATRGSLVRDAVLITDLR
jgi:serine/threonine protein kinase/Tol biopolymer transport system component